MRIAKPLSILFVAMVMQGCATAPSLFSPRRGDDVENAGPKIGSLMSHLKCELYEAANSDEELPRYQNMQDLRPREDKEGDEKREHFSLRSIFSQIEYIAEAQFTLEVTENAGINPSVSFIKPLAEAGTSFAMLASANVSEQSRKTLMIHTSVDFARLVGSDKKVKDLNVRGEQLFLDARQVPVTPCESGRELQGHLGLRESLSASLIASAMNDIAVLPGVVGKSPVREPSADHTFGLTTLTVEFQVTQTVAGGPNWSLTRFAGPSLGGSLFSVNRTPKDTLQITFVPVCVRRSHAPISQSKTNGQWEYKPDLAIGTPVWARFLPQCPEYKSSRNAELRLAALRKARLYNYAARIGTVVVP